MDQTTETLVPITIIFSFPKLCTKPLAAPNDFSELQFYFILHFVCFRSSRMTAESFTQETCTSRQLPLLCFFFFSSSVVNLEIQLTLAESLLSTYFVFNNT